jgi:hypothetical protein
MVNTDGDNQYSGKDIAKLVQPILDGRADMVIGDRQTDELTHFSWTKKLLQRWGSQVVRKASGLNVRDSTSGFRAVNRSAMYTLFVHNRFSYTLETIIQAGNLGLAVENVPVDTRVVDRPSRLFRSIPHYLRQSVPVILRSYAMYRPGKTFGALAAVFLTAGSLLIGRFFYYYLLSPSISSHIQSLQIGVGAVVLAFIVGLMAYLGDLIAANRRLSEEMLGKLRRMDAELKDVRQNDASAPEGIQYTGVLAWLPEPRV